MRVKTIHGTEGIATFIENKRGNDKFEVVFPSGECRNYFDYELTMLNFQFRHKDKNIICTCKVHPEVCEVTWTDQGIFNSSLFDIEHLKLSIKYGDWIVVDQNEIIKGEMKND